MQGFGREVGPIGGREIEFAVGALEGQVVADTLLAAGADDESGSGCPAEYRHERNASSVTASGLTPCCMSRRAARRISSPPRIVEGKIDDHVGTLRRAVHGMAQGRARGKRQPSSSPNTRRLMPLRSMEGSSSPRKLTSSWKSRLTSSLGRPQFFLREGVERQVADAERAALGHDGFGGADAGLMPSLRDRPRSCAQRPLPSMMMAMWAGSEAAGIGSGEGSDMDVR